MWMYYIIRNGSNVIYQGTDFDLAQGILPNELQDLGSYSFTSFLIFDEDPQNRIAIISKGVFTTRESLTNPEKSISIPLSDLESLVGKDITNRD